MTEQNDKIIGILGGMGSEATAALFSLIIENTDAHNDHEHAPVLIYNNPKIPDRSAYLLGYGSNPVPLLIEGSRKLEIMGASCILWPCNTAHYFAEEVQKHLSVPVIHMIRETAVYVRSAFPSGTRFGLLATEGTYKTELYRDIFAEEGVDLLVPSEKNKEITMISIYGEKGIKAGYHKEPVEMLQAPLRELRDHGADVVIAGCTELSLVLNPRTTGMDVLDPMRILARAAIRFVQYPLKDEQPFDLI
ncbi:MAG: amino acid racemase [Chlorobi bacterium]|nr:amino acid racemase [Chlorobiota bacterium]